MFEGKLSVLKNLIYLILLGAHTFLFAYFLYITFQNLIVTIIETLSIVSIIALAMYSFLTTKPYYYYFYISIIVSSFPIIFIVYLASLLVVPELSILIILLWRGLNKSETYMKMRVDKKANLFQHDPAVVNPLSGVAKTLPFRMEEVWNPDSTIPIRTEETCPEKNNLRVKMQLISFSLTIVFLICSFITVYIYLAI
jgi:hypothetical protein